MGYYDIYIDNLAQTPSESYKGLSQATLNAQWDNTTQLRTIKEQSYPFTNTYTEYEAWVDTVSDITVNTTKVIGDFIGIMFKDIDHTINHRGQKYLYKPDGISENVYLCYDRLNPLTQVPDFKAIRCNNHLTMLGKNGEIIKEPCSLAYEITATNNNVTKDSTIAQRRMVLIVQANDNTKDIVLNQRFIFQHKQAYRVTEYNVLNQEDYNDENVTLYTFYIEWSPINKSTDNLNLNLADYYNSIYTLTINSTDLSLSSGSVGQLSATVKLNDVEQSSVPLKWSTIDSDVVEIDQLGNYQVVGLDGSTALITCSIDGNSEVFDTINLSVVATPIVDKKIIINPTTYPKLLQGKSVEINYGVYNGDILTSDVVIVTPSGANPSNYNLAYLSGKLVVTNLLKSTTPLTLTFTSGTLDTKILTMQLGGII